MNDKLLKTLSTLVSKLPKKDLEANIKKAKDVLKTSNNEELSKLLSNPQVSKLLGKDAENLKEQIKNIDLKNINTDELEQKLHIEKRR